MQRNLVRGLAVALALATFVVTGAPDARSDDLDDRRANLDRALAAADHAIDDASAQVNLAVTAANAAKEELSGAQARLAKAESATAAARKLAEQRKQELAAAEHQVRKAEADVAAAQAAFDSTDARINEEITVITQQSGALVDFALLLTDIDMSRLNQRAQLSETLFTASAIQLDELQARRFTLDAAKVAADAARADAEAARRAADDQLAVAQEVEAEADRLRDEVAAKVTARDAALSSAREELAQEEQRQAALEAESKDVDKRIADRVAAAEAKRAAEEAARKQQSTTSQSNSGSSSSSSATFLRPVDGRITSPYGMRLHPVLGYWKLHDGTDFGASCDTPIRAAQDGVVAERYYNSGYGNRLMIDHGRFDGKYVTTGYNHASRYVVGVGQKVSRGQVIGYVGSTGYSTGCHLHLMVWENGSVVDPMARWFR